MRNLNLLASTKGIDKISWVEEILAFVWSASCTLTLGQYIYIYIYIYMCCASSARSTLNHITHKVSTRRWFSCEDEPQTPLGTVPTEITRIHFFQIKPTKLYNTCVSISGSVVSFLSMLAQWSSENRLFSDTALLLVFDFFIRSQTWLGGQMSRQIRELLRKFKSLASAPQQD